MTVARRHILAILRRIAATKPCISFYRKFTDGAYRRFIDWRRGV